MKSKLIRNGEFQGLEESCKLKAGFAARNDDWIICMYLEIELLTFAAFAESFGGRSTFYFCRLR
jgi:hypothetical protein